MADITAKLFWYRVKEWCSNMADKLSDFVYADDSKETVDIINLLLLGWILLGIAVYIIGNIIATQLRKRKSTFPPAENESKASGETSEVVREHVSSETEAIPTKNEDFFENLELKEKVPLIPTCSGDDPEVVEWINKVFTWIYTQRIVSPIIHSWLSALNARTRLASTDHGILVDFKDLIHSSPPLMTDISEFFSHRGDMTVVCQVHIDDVTFEITVTQFKDSDKIIIPFTLHLKSLSGTMTIECVPEELTFIGRFTDPPETELSAKPVKDDLHPTDNQHLSNVVCEIATEALSSSLINLRFSCFSECPRFVLRSPLSDVDTLEPSEKEGEQLLVKIIKACNLGGNQGCIKPYCVVEMDEPPQKFETREIEEKLSPFWDESFVFTVKDASAELLFEIYDKGKPSKENFLGLGIVSVDELIRNPSQRQIIPLQSRPLEDDNITGSLTTEFLFLNQSTPVSEVTHLAKSNSASLNGKTVETNSRITAGGTVITTTTIKRTKEDNHGSVEASPNTIANTISNNFSEIYLTTLHEVKEELIQKCNGHIEHNETNHTNKHTLELNGNCKMFNTVPLENDKTYINDDHSEYDQKDAVIKTNDNGGTLTQRDKVSQIENYTLETPVENEMSQNACSDTMAMHALPKPPIIVVDEHDKINGNAINDGEIVDEVNLHENDENIESLHASKTDDSTSVYSSSASLPTIPENIEINSSPSNDLEKKDGDADLTGTALKELEKHGKPVAPNKSTLIIHSVQRPDSSVSESLEASPASHISKDSCTSYSESAPSSVSQEQNGDDRSRPKEKRTFIGNLRRKLSFRKTRSRSAEHRSETGSMYSHASSRSASTDRIKHPSGSKPLPFKTGKFIGSTRSSISEASGISAASNRTYINENSTLVIETNENGIIKRYLIPNSLIHQSKWKKRGTKLHIYNDHVFVAKHLSGVTTCQACQKYLTRRPGKQGYQCRGCNLQCHKRCHVKVTNFCPNSSISTMEVEYIQDPRGTPKSV